MLWPVQDTAWTASYWWFLGMVIAFTAARLILVKHRTRSGLMLRDSRIRMKTFTVLQHGRARPFASASPSAAKDFSPRCQSR